ncbi:MAG TPA: NAD(P)-dependent oxidoreductase [Caulobacteraceae bacterium]|nr:NAD(P)-dependent oxidoreductase [Caulobacteraceae bacterium]
MEAFPAFFPLRGARVAIAGSGDGAEAKARLLAGSPADVVRLEGAAAHDPARYAGAALAFIADPDPAFCKQAAGAARAAGAAVNVADEPTLCDFHTPAIIDRGAVVAAIGTAGAAPMIVSLLRADIEIRLPAGIGAAAEVLGEQRETIRAALPDLPRRRAFLRRLLAGPFTEAAARRRAEAARLLDEALAAANDASGEAILINPPASPGLLTLDAYRDLTSADVLIVGPGAEAVASLARRDVTRLSLAEGGAQRIAALVGQGARVVVLDPAAEALRASLEAAGIAVRTHPSATGR